MNLLSMEIQTIKNTRDMLAGIMPEGFDSDEMGDFQDDIEASIKSYTNEIETEIENVNRQTSDLKLQINNDKETQGSLISQKIELQKKIENIKADMGEPVDKPQIVAEINLIRERKEQLDKDLARNSQDTIRIESDIKDFIEQLKHHQKVKNDLAQKYTELASVKQKMDAVGEVETEIQRLKTEADKNDMETSVNKRLLVTVTDINKDIESINEQLRSAVKNNGRRLENFYSLMDGLLS